MKKINFALILFFVFAVSGCGSTATPSPSPTEISTPLPQPTVASAPTAIPSPSAVVPTSEPPLKTDGPYFTYFREVNGVYQLVMMDADGGGRKVIDLPQGFVDSLTNQYGLVMKLVSPDGKWLAFYTGTAGKWDVMPAQGESNLTLSLLNLATGEKQIVSPLLSTDYPNNFVEAAKQRNDPETTAGSLYGAFIAGIIQAIAWSPDGRYLAFAGQMDGLSSDLYVYDLNTQKVQRLSSGDQELQWINWSPDGEWIAYGSAFWAGEGMQYSAYSVTKDGSVTHNLSTGYIDYWLNSHEYFVFDNGNGVGNFNLRLVDVNSGKIATVWRGIFHEYKVNPSNDWLVLVAITSVLPTEQEKPNFVPGLQLINLKTLKDIQNPSQLLNPPDSFVRANDGKIIPLVIPLKANDEIINASPDANYWAIANSQDIKIYSSDIALTKDVSIPNQDVNLTDIQWNPDSSCLFLVYKTKIYSMNILNGDIHLVETNLIDNYGSTYKWITGQ